MNSSQNINPYDLLDYYVSFHENREKLDEWSKTPRKLKFNIDFPLSHASGITKLLVKLGIVRYDGTIFIYISNYWKKYIDDAIRLGFIDHLKAHHKTRNKVEEILNTAFTNEWITAVKSVDNLNKLSTLITKRISEICDSHK